jgi:hypothetical protein
MDFLKMDFHQVLKGKLIMLEKVDINSIINNLHKKGIIDNIEIAMNNKTESTEGLVYTLSEHNEY